MKRSRHAIDGDCVVLLDEDGRPAGEAARLEVHGTDTPLHLAFSTYLFDAQGRVLLTRRAIDKLTWPGVWTNSCCGHPRPGEAMEDAIRRRVREELGLDVQMLTKALPDFRYRAVDASGVVENEICPVYLAFVDSEPTPHPGEVMDYRWVDWESFVSGITAVPDVYSPWAVLQVAQLAPKLPRLIGGPPRSPSDVAACLAEVDALIVQELQRLGDTWNRFAGDIGVDVLPEDLPQWLESIMLAGGKRFRVAMTYWGFVAAGGVPGRAGYRSMMQAAAALETLHLFALIHDDVMDCSDSRRNRPTAHVEAAEWHRASAKTGEPARFGENLAILLGDLAHTLADALMDRLPERLRRAWYELCIELIVGQRADLTSAAAGRRNLMHAKAVARLKSGAYTVTRPLQLGALAAGASDEALDALMRAGEDIGQAFAYRDDILGAWGDPARTGKPSGDDLAEGKETVIMALAAGRLVGEDADRLARMGSERMRDDDVAILQRALVEAGVRDEVERLIDKRMESAFAHLALSSLDPDGVAGLREAARTAAWRES